MKLNSLFKRKHFFVANERSVCVVEYFISTRKEGIVLHVHNVD